MKLFQNILIFGFSSFQNKVYYPALLSPNYDNIEYASYYYQRASTMQIKQINKYQINDQTLPKFLQKQIVDDKKFFVKQKQFLFIGRSNVGKSTLLNTIFNNKSIARCAKHAGTTKFLHFHRIHNQNSYVIDAPGYGFANMNKRRRHLWFGLTQQYMKVSTRLSQIFVLINFQHGLKQIDKQFLSRIDKFNVNIQLILTKVDKVKSQNYFNQFRAINQEIRRMELKNVNQLVFACSTKTKFGINQLRCRILQAAEDSMPRKTDNQEDLLLSYVRNLRVTPTQLQQKQSQLSKEYIVRKLIYNSNLSKYLVK